MFINVRENICLMQCYNGDYPSTKEHTLGYEHILSYYSRPLGDTKRISEKEELHPHFFIPWRGQCKVRLRPGRNNFFFKKEENTTISRKSLPGVGKGGEPNILTRPWQKRRTEDFY